MAEHGNIRNSAAQFNRVFEEGVWFELQLYIAGATAYSAHAVRVIRHICDHALKKRCRLRIINIYESPQLAREAQILAVPTLVRTTPPPIRKLVGDLSDRDRVLRFLDLPVAAGEGAL